MASTALAPTPSVSTVGSTDPSANVAGGPSHISRPMRLKVSYSFDDESKSNCLARWPHLISTPVVQVDAELLVGAVELKTCILSIISASPELVATLSQDYSVYAFDFSEPGFPLVGCGMLSWAMLNSQNSSTRIMVTGRVSCNTFGFFSNDGVKETLEVKFKLHKVDTFTQEQFVKSVHTYTALSRLLPRDFDASAWSNFLAAHPEVLNSPLGACAMERVGNPPPPPPSRVGTGSVPGSQPAPQAPIQAIPQSTSQSPHPTIARSSPSSGPPVSQATTPNTTETTPQPVAQSVPESTSQPLSQPQAARTWQEPAVLSDDTGQPPKKKQKTAPKRATKSKKKTVAAAAAATAVAVAVAAPPANTPLLEPEDVPPSGQEKLGRTQDPIVSQMASEQSAFLKPSLSRDASVTSVNAEPSPAMASSPPAQSDLGDVTSIPSPAPTSPYLPSLPNPPIAEPSGSRALETLMEEPEPPSESARSDCAQQSTGLVLPTSLPPAAALPDLNGNEVPVSGDSSMGAASKKLKRRSSKSGDTAAVSNETIGEGQDTRSRSGTPGSRVEKPKASSKTRTAAHVKERIENQLLEAVRNGRMPNYCNNCGAIETAVWRKVRLSCDKSQSAQDAESLTSAKEEGTDAQTESQKDDEFRSRSAEVLLCNACGLWFLSHKTMRPQQLWGAKPEPAKPHNPRKRKKQSVHAPTPPASSAPEPATDPVIETIVSSNVDYKDPPTVGGFSTATGVDLNDKVSKSGPDEEECSSRATPPVPGSAHSPIDLDAEIDGKVSPRRLLFPSARKGNGGKRPKSTVRAPGKENKPPRKLSDLADGHEVTPPKTPTREMKSAFKLRTPLRSASGTMSSGTVITSPCRSGKGVLGAPPPATPERRLLKHHQRMSLSPSAGLLEKLLADDTTILGDLGNLPDFEDLGNIPFELDDALLNTDITMPSSPPAQFSFFEDDGTASDVCVDNANGDWSDFLPSSPSAFSLNDLFEGQSSKDGERENNLTVDLSAFIQEHSSSGSCSDGSAGEKDSPTSRQTVPAAEREADAGVGSERETVESVSKSTSVPAEESREIGRESESNGQKTREASTEVKVEEHSGDTP